ncbi:MAG: cyclase family protein [Candidatus Woesearchaeota archaeon]
MIIDLTYPIHEGMFKYPSDPDPEIYFKLSESVVNSKNYVHKFTSGFVNLTIRNHHGTHVDAPAHKLPGGNTIDDYLLDRFVNKAIIIEIPDIASRELKSVLFEDVYTRVDFKALEENGVTALLFYTGYSDRIAENEGKLNGKEKTDFESDFTYLTPAAALYLSENAPFLNIVGIDSFSFDPKGSNSEAHKLFFIRDILLLETLVNLADLSKVVGNTPFELISVPLLFKGADAAPCRAYAII